jgi:hypothetical protein
MLDRSYLKKREPEPTVLPEDVELRFEDWANNVDWFRPDAIDWVSKQQPFAFMSYANLSRFFGINTSRLKATTLKAS